MQVKIWWSPKKHSIELRGEGRPASFISTVHADATSARGNPNLFWKLAECLRKAGAPAPESPPKQRGRADKARSGVKRLEGETWWICGGEEMGRADIRAELSETALSFTVDDVKVYEGTAYRRRDSTQYEGRFGYRDGRERRSGNVVIYELREIGDGGCKLLGTWNEEGTQYGWHAELSYVGRVETRPRSVSYR